MSILELTDVGLSYDVTGDGEPLVLMPGFASGAWSWNWQRDELAKSLEVITFDPRGVSNSPIKNEAAVTISSIAEDVADLLDHLNIDAAHVLGVSFGGFVAQEYALRYPDKLKKLVLASTSFGGKNHVAPSIEVLAAFASTKGLNSAGRIRKSLKMAFSRDFVRDHGETVETFSGLRAENVVPETVYMQQLLSAMAFDAEERVPDICAPTLVITGEEDVVVPKQNSVNLAAKIPDARLKVIAGTGHMAFVESSTEFNALVRDFLSE